jgi:hypothetical protein
MQTTHFDMAKDAVQFSTALIGLVLAAWNFISKKEKNALLHIQFRSVYSGR